MSWVRLIDMLVEKPASNILESLASIAPLKLKRS